MSNYPNIWGAGAIFAHSGLDGITTYTNSLVGMLCGDKLGVSFECSTVELVAVPRNVKFWEHIIVASDIFSTEVNYDKSVDYLFVGETAIVGRVPADCMEIHLVSYADKVSKAGQESVELNEKFYVLQYKTVDGYTQFAFAAAASLGEAEVLAAAGLAVDIETERAKKLAYFDNLPVCQELTYEQQLTLKKCYSVMKSQFYTPEAPFNCLWTTPNRQPHKSLWLWDSVFHSFGNVFISADAAKQTLQAVLCAQKEDGVIPLMANPYVSSAITQPPVLAWGFYRLYQANKDMELIKEVYDKLAAYLEWDIRNRKVGNTWLFGWDVNEDDPNCRCDECGMDNSPRFDDVKPMYSIDFSCFMAQEARCMAKLAEVIGKDGSYWSEMYERIKADVNNMLWDEEDGLYYDRLVREDELKKVKAVSSFLPMYAGLCDEERAKRLVEMMLDENVFWSVAGVATVSKDHPTYGTDMWRGPIWIVYNYLTICGLKECGFITEAEELRQRTLNIITKWYFADGVIYEFFENDGRVSSSKLNRKGKIVTPYNFEIKYQAVRDFGWSSTLYVALAMKNY